MPLIITSMGINRSHIVVPTEVVCCRQLLIARFYMEVSMTITLTASSTLVIVLSAPH